MSLDQIFYDDDERNLYAVIGIYITLFQHLEDFLVHVFANACDNDINKMRAIYHLIRGLDKKIEFIDAALTSVEHKSDWSILSSRLRDASKVRGDIAHGNSAVEFDDLIAKENDGEVAVIISGNIKSKLIKNNKKSNGYTHYSLEIINEKFFELRKLDQDIRAFCWKLAKIDPSEVIHFDGPIPRAMFKRSSKSLAGETE